MGFIPTCSVQNFRIFFYSTEFFIVLFLVFKNVAVFPMSIMSNLVFTAQSLSEA